MSDSGKKREQEITNAIIGLLIIAIAVYYVINGEPPPLREWLGIGSSQTDPTIVGHSRDNPAPLGSPVIDEKDVEVAITNTRLVDEDGDQVVIVKVKVRNRGDRNKTANISPSDFRLVGEKGIIYERDYSLTRREGGLESSEIFGGSFIEGEIAFKTDYSERKRNFVLIYDRGFGTSARFLSLGF